MLTTSCLSMYYKVQGRDCRGCWDVTIRGPMLELRGPSTLHICYICYAASHSL